jgi:Predicted transmembrane sensor domain
VKSLILKYKNYLIFLLILSLLILLKSFNPNFIKSISFLSFDLYQKVIPLNKQDSDVIIIDIDEKSLGKFGQFPWNRSVLQK